MKHLIIPFCMRENNIRRLLKERGMSVKALEIGTGYTHDSIMKINRGATALTQDSMRKIADVIGCYPSELLPDSWQKPSIGLDMNLLESAIKDADTLLEAANKKIDNPQKKALLIKYLYEYYCEQRKEGREPSKEEKQIFLRLVK